MSVNNKTIIDEFVKELDFNLDIIERFVPAFNINDKEVLTSLSIGLDMIRELRHDISSTDTLKHTVDIGRVIDDYMQDESKMTTSASSEIRVMRQNIIEYGDGTNEDEDT